MRAPPQPPRAALGLLERAVGYARAGLPAVTPDMLDWPTPCRGWDVRALLAHLADSLGLLAGALAGGNTVSAAAAAGASDPAAEVRDRAAALLAAAVTAAATEAVAVGGRVLSGGLVASVGALETAVHGWDLGAACGAAAPLPPRLAGQLLDLAPLLVSPADRPGGFAAPVPPPPGAGPGERLLAFLGRAPR